MNLENIKIRETDCNDFEDIMDVEEKAFGSVKEAKLTADLLNDNSAKPMLSLLAFHEQKAIGHILFTRAFINKKNQEPMAHILAPLAVIPEYQKKGIGGMLTKEGLRRLKKIGSEVVFVLGHIEYYPKHGFIPDANKLGFPAPYPIPDEFANAWMVQSLGNIKLESYNGIVICSDQLDKPEHWRE